jgi:PadR family transcriptional regulator PadR
MTFENWQEQLRRGGLDLAILLAVARGPRYGLDIIRHLEESTDLVVTEGTIYPILARLTREGALEAEWVAGEAPHPRKYYRLTDGGRRKLERMLEHWQAFTDKIGRLIAAARRR